MEGESYFSIRGHAHSMCRARALNLATCTAKACRKSKVTLYRQRKEEVYMFLILASISPVDYTVLI